MLLTLVVGTAALLVELQQRRDETVRQSLIVKNKLVALLNVVQDAESGQRGYLLTGEAQYLEPYYKAVGRLGPALAEVRGATGSRPFHKDSLARLHALIDEKMGELRLTITQRQSGNAVDALATMYSSSEKSLMNQIRDIVGGMDWQESQILYAHLQGSRKMANLLRAGILLAAVIIVALAVYSIRQTRRRAEIIIRQRDELVVANQALLLEKSTREAAENQVRQLQKMEAVGLLTGGVAHDFNNMLAVIISGLELMQRRLAKGDAKLEKYIEAAMDAANRAATLTQRLLAFSRQQALKPQGLNPNRLVRHMSDLLRRTLGADVVVESVLGAGLWRVHADQGQLENAIVNLCVNARDAMPEGGTLTIETANVFLDAKYAAQNEDVAVGQYVMIAISDTGTGMLPEVARRAFDPFFTTKEVGRGTGLGLSQVYGFVKQSGGHVKIYSEVGRGTSVKIYLPRYRGGFEERDRHTQPAPLPSGSKDEVVLVVEDEQRVRDLSVTALKELGYTVVAADGAEAALRRIDEMPQISLLFTDIVMPEVNGRKLAEEAQRRRPDLKVLYTTGFTRDAVVHNGVLEPGVQLLQKPYTLEDLANKVRETLQGHGP